MKVKFERQIIISPAFDKRSPIPSKDYGIGSMDIFFVLIGKKGATSCIIGTDIFLPETIKEYREKGNSNLPPPINLRKDVALTGYSIDVHSKKPQYDGQQKGKCGFIGKYCYCGGSFLRAEKFGEVLLRNGSDTIWKILEQEYKLTWKK